MPSGAKKRKAAKKRKENQPNPSSTSTHSHGGDNVKHQDDKEYNVGEVSSAASQDHHSQQSILTASEEDGFEKRENVSNLPYTEGAEFEVGSDHNVVVEGTDIPIEREFKIKRDEPRKKSYGGGSSRSASSNSSSSSSSSSSGSDDESHDTKSGQAVADIYPIVDSIKVANTLSEENAEAFESATIVGGSDSIKNGDEKQSCPEDQAGVSVATKDDTSHREEAIVPSVENIEQETDDQLNLSYDAPVATADNVGNAENDPEVTETFFFWQPLLVPSSRPVQTTLWKSCCGLFELFTGSGR